MECHLFNLCCLADGWHWLLIAVDGHIYRVSERGFTSREAAQANMLRYS